MRPRLADEARARAEAIFNHREQQKVDESNAPVDTPRDRAAHVAVVERMRGLKRLRLGRERNAETESRDLAPHVRAGGYRLDAKTVKNIFDAEVGPSRKLGR